MADALMDRIKAHRGAPDVYDPPTFDQMADRILELEDRIEFLYRILHALAGKVEEIIGIIQK